MKTHTAEIVDLSASEGKDGDLHFETEVLVESGLYNPLIEFRSKYQRAFTERKQKNLAFMEDLHDKLLNEHRRLLAICEAIGEEKLASLQNHGNAEAALLNATHAVNNMQRIIENSAPKTFAEQKADQVELARLRNVEDQARIRESNLIIELQAVEYRRMQAAENANKARIEYLDTKGRLNALLGKKDNYSSQTGLSLA
jgi:hypothetical protein